MDSLFTFITGLLTAALSLVGFVQTHPELPQSSRDQAVQVVQEAVGKANDVVVNQKSPIGLPQTIQTLNQKREQFKRNADMQGDLLFNTWAKTVAVMVTRKDILTNDTPNIRAFVTRWEQEIHAVYDEWGSISSADVTIDTWGTDQLNKMATRLTVNQNHIDAIKLAYTTIPMSEVQKFQGLLATDTGSAKSVGRDERRVADIDQLKLALRLYYGEKGNYPSKLAMLVPTINTVPTDPKTGVPYKYAALSVSDTSRCSSYHLGAILEVVDYPALSTDSDAQPKTVCSGSGPDFSGTDPVFDITK